MVGHTNGHGGRFDEHVLVDAVRYQMHQDMKRDIQEYMIVSLSREEAKAIIAEQEAIAREENLKLLTEKRAEEVSSRQGEFLTSMVADIKVNGGATSADRKAYACRVYGKDVAPGLNSNHCLIVQMASLNMANAELGTQVSAELRQINTELDTDNILQIKNRYQRKINDELQPGVVDTLGMGENFRINDFFNKYGGSEHMDNVAVDPNVERTGVANYSYKGQPCSYKGKLADKGVSLASYVDENGYVIKDENGNPKLKDGDFAFVNTSADNENSSGYHAIRLNVDENGKVTYTAGNSERIKQPLGGLRKVPCAVFHTQDYIADCLRDQYNDLSNEQLQALAMEQYPEQAKVVDKQGIYDQCYNKRKGRYEQIGNSSEQPAPVASVQSNQETLVAEQHHQGITQAMFLHLQRNKSNG